jgi:hypothetical protein
MATALSTLNKRMEDFAFIDRRRNVFVIWAAQVKKERNCFNSIIAIGRKYFALEFFARIRRFAKEQELEKSSEDRMNKFFRILKNGQLNSAFSKWRTTNMNEKAKDMRDQKTSIVQQKQDHKDKIDKMQDWKIKKAANLIKKWQTRKIFNALLNTIIEEK